MLAHIEAFYWESDPLCHLLTENDIVRLEAVEIEDKDWCSFIELHLLDSVPMSLALPTVPAIV